MWTDLNIIYRLHYNAEFYLWNKCNKLHVYLYSYYNSPKQLIYFMQVHWTVIVSYRARVAKICQESAVDAYFKRSMQAFMCVRFLARVSGHLRFILLLFSAYLYLL